MRSVSSETSMNIIMIIVIIIIVIKFIIKACWQQWLPLSLSQFSLSLSLSLSLAIRYFENCQSSRRYKEPTQSLWMLVFGGRPTLVCPCVGFHKWSSLMNSFLLLQHCPECPAHLTWMVCVMGSKWPHSSTFVGHVLICSKLHVVSLCRFQQAWSQFLNQGSGTTMQ